MKTPTWEIRHAYKGITFKRACDAAWMPALNGSSFFSSSSLTVWGTLIHAAYK